MTFPNCFLYHPLFAFAYIRTYRYTYVHIFIVLVPCAHSRANQFKCQMQQRVRANASWLQKKRTFRYCWHFCRVEKNTREFCGSENKSVRDRQIQKGIQKKLKETSKEVLSLAVTENKI